MLSIKSTHFAGPGVDWDSYVVWAGNKLPKYLWDHWKAQLKPAGLTWQKFMRVLRHRTDVCVMWYKGALPWSEFIVSVAHLIAGPIGADIKGASPDNLKRPVDVAQWQIPPMRDWEKFERLCSDLWKRIWNDPNVQRHGRSGQRQHGVDIYGTVRRSRAAGGVQCKKKDATSTDDALDVAEMREIVEEAKSFRPALSEFVIAYTGKRDAKLQSEARRITEDHRKKGLFDVHIYSWDDILEGLGDQGDIVKKHFPELAGVNVDERELEKRLEGVETVGRETLARVTEAGISVDKLTREVAQSVKDSTAVTGEHSAEIDHARDLIDALKPKEALEYLVKLEKRIWDSANDMLRFRMLTNKAAALSSLGEEEEAGKLFIQAHQYNAADEKAICNRALGHLLLGQLGETKEFAEKVIEKNPMSGRAYGLLVHCFPDSEPLEKVIQSVPTEIRKTEDVAYAIAHAARKRGDLEGAIRWLEVALDHSIKKRKKNPDLRANLASTILESFKSKHEVLDGIQLTPEDKARITRAIQLLTEAIDDLSVPESMKYRTFWFTNRSAAYKLIGEVDKAILDVETALRARSDDPATLKQNAFLLYAKGDRDSAIGILRRVLGRPEVPEALLLAGMLYEEGSGEEAEKILENSLLTDIPEDVRAEERRLLIQISLKAPNYDRAREISASMRAGDPTNVLNLVIAARIERLAGRVDMAASLIDEARGYVTEKTDSRHIIELADELYALEKYPDAWPLYERIADPRVDTRLTRHLLYSYYRSNEVERALEMCKLMPAEDKGPFLIQIELSILEDIGDLRQAATVAEGCLRTRPDDLQLRIRLAVIWYRLEDFQELDSFLGKGVDVSKSPVDAGFQLSRLYAERGMVEKSLQTAYELRRAHFDNGEAHLKYVGIFFGGEHKLDQLLQAPGDVRVGTAVRVKNDTGASRWHLLEDRGDINAAMGEVGVNNDFGKKLLGTRIGEEVLISQGDISETKVTVVEIKSKYVHALHESLELLPERFADTRGIERVAVKTGTDEETRESIQKMLDAVSKRSEWVTQAEKFYRESRFTIGVFARLIGKSVIDVWSGLVGSKWGVKSCIGSVEERQGALALLEKHRIVAIDITALLTAAQLELLDVLEKQFTRILITQSTIDLLQEAISERKSMAARGYTTVWKMEDQFFRHEITPEDISKQIEHLERVKDWARKRCEVTPCKSAPKIARRKELEDMLGPSFLETILIAREHDCPLYTDDFGTRALARSEEFTVGGVWTQAVAMRALFDRRVTEQDYNKSAIRLILLKHRHTTINGAIILEAAREAKWSNDRPFKEVLETLRGSQMEIRSVVGVLVEFMFLLSQQPVLDFQRDALTTAALDVLADRRDDRLVVRLVRGAVQARFRLVPLAERRVQQVISAWESLKVGPVTLG